MRCKGTKRWKYKTQAIKEAISLLSRAVGKHRHDMVFVPVPSSKAVGHAECDPRMSRIGKAVAQNAGGSFAELVSSSTSFPASHEAEFNEVERTSLDELVNAYEVNDTTHIDKSAKFIVFDDVITTGRHFKAMQKVLSNRFPKNEIRGLFIARSIPFSEAPDFSDLC